jgi:hypothetical protein
MEAAGGEGGREAAGGRSSGGAGGSLTLCAFLILITAVFKLRDFNRVRIVSFSAARAALMAADEVTAESGLYINGDDDEEEDDAAAAAVEDDGDVRVEEKTAEAAVRGADKLLLVAEVLMDCASPADMAKCFDDPSPEPFGVIISGASAAVGAILVLWEVSTYLTLPCRSRSSTGAFTEMALLSLRPSTT